MAHRGWFQLGQTEIANSRRVVRYMEHGVKNTTAQVVTDDSWPQLATWLGRAEDWQLPELDDDCPWYDPLDSASAEFAGVWPMSVEGLETTPLDRDVIEGALVGGSFGVDRTPPREIRFEAVVVGRTPAGLRYGLEWLGSALRGSACRDDEGPRRLLFLDSAPAFEALLEPGEVARLGNAQSRMLVDVVQTKALTIEEAFGPWTPEGRGATAARVSFELTAGVPYIWRTPVNLLAGLALSKGVAKTLQFENVGPGGVLAACGNQETYLVDPQSAPLVAVPRPVSPNAAVGMQPLLSLRSTWLLEAGRLPIWSETVPSVTIRTGAKDERAIRVQWVKGLVTAEKDIRCETVGEALVGYIPANSRFTLDAMTGEARVITPEGVELDATPVVTGRLGGPWRPPVLTCSQAYTLVVDTLRDVSAQTTLSVDGYVRQV